MTKVRGLRHVHRSYAHIQSKNYQYAVVFNLKQAKCLSKTQNIFASCEKSGNGEIYSDKKKELDNAGRLPSNSLPIKALKIKKLIKSATRLSKSSLKENTKISFKCLVGSRRVSERENLESKNIQLTIHEQNLLTKIAIVIKKSPKGVCFLSTERLATSIEKSEPQTRRYLKKFISAGLMEVAGMNGRHRSYKLTEKATDNSYFFIKKETYQKAKTEKKLRLFDCSKPLNFCSKPCSKLNNFDQKVIAKNEKVIAKNTESDRETIDAKNLYLKKDIKEKKSIKKTDSSFCSSEKKQDLRITKPCDIESLKKPGFSIADFELDLDRPTVMTSEKLKSFPEHERAKRLVEYLDVETIEMLTKNGQPLINVLNRLISKFYTLGYQTFNFAKCIKKMALKQVSKEKKNLEDLQFRYGKEKINLCIEKLDKEDRLQQIDNLPRYLETMLDNEETEARMLENAVENEIYVESKKELFYKLNLSFYKKSKFQLVISDYPTQKVFDLKTSPNMFLPELRWHLQEIIERKQAQRMEYGKNY